MRKLESLHAHMCCTSMRRPVICSVRVTQRTARQSRLLNCGCPRCLSVTINSRQRRRWENRRVKRMTDWWRQFSARDCCNWSVVDCRVTPSLHRWTRREKLPSFVASGDASDLCWRQSATVCGNLEQSEQFAINRIIPYSLHNWNLVSLLPANDASRWPSGSDYPS